MQGEKILHTQLVMKTIIQKLDNESRNKLASTSSIMYEFVNSTGDSEFIKTRELLLKKIPIIPIEFEFDQNQLVAFMKDGNRFIYYFPNYTDTHVNYADMLHKKILFRPSFKASLYARLLDDLKSTAADYNSMLADADDASLVEKRDATLKMIAVLEPLFAGVNMKHLYFHDISNSQAGGASWHPVQIDQKSKREFIKMKNRRWYLDTHANKFRYSRSRKEIRLL